MDIRLVKQLKEAIPTTYHPQYNWDLSKDIAEEDLELFKKEKFDEIKSTYNTKLFEKYKISGCSDYSPIFIIGMPRSCTTLVEQILSSHSKVHGAEEVEFIPHLIKIFIPSFLE